MKCVHAVQGEKGVVCFSIKTCERQKIKIAQSGGSRLLCKDPLTDKFDVNGFPKVNAHPAQADGKAQIREEE